MKRTIALLVIWFVCQIAAIISSIRYLWAVFSNQDRAWKIALSYDRLANSVTNDDEVQTISSRAGKAKLQGKKWGCLLCYLLEKIQPNHCENSITE